LGFGKALVKRFYSQLASVFGESLRIHEGDGAEPPHVAVVKSPTVVKAEVERRVGETFGVE
jgi:hypothetical protein